ncbi:hypothetical protein GALMADRAFT_1327451 [Galerina marginata CBS 339.88]|uniref:HNH nuclease domain-containing protein n=1 Tax=Galerina marginata (strain CBS 339.88) TaxID=685588 RepID=A0A067TB58_GALM3|nr:hypothetical protein GALMADRAFT_1327451 [Galerina marginata CBS 339.88]
MTATEIKVYASLPRVAALGGDLNLDANNWHWLLCLTLPLVTLDALQFSPRPYKWIRYAIGIVVGAEGDLSSSSDLINVVDYNAGLPTESVALYYHTSDDEKRRMFPVDPNIGRTNITSSVATSRRAQFHSAAAMRDGNRCVLTGIDEDVCDAVHLLAHSKGDTYISTYTQRRSRDPARADIVQDIDSVRNGLLLNNYSHRGLGRHIAFLSTPNFAMDTTDVDPTAPAGEKRYTAHLFEPSKPFFSGGTSEPPSGVSLRISHTPDWPPAILFEAVYASTVLHHFGAQLLKDEVAATWKYIFYLDGVMSQAQAEHKEVVGRQARYDAYAGPDNFDILLALPYILMPPDELQAMMREAKEKAAGAEQRDVQEKVNNWNKQIIAS